MRLLAGADDLSRKCQAQPFPPSEGHCPHHAHGSLAPVYTRFFSARIVPKPEWKSRPETAKTLAVCGVTRILLRSALPEIMRLTSLG